MDDLRFLQNDIKLTFAQEDSAPGQMTAMVARYGPRIMLDGRRIFWTSAMFDEFKLKFKDGDRPLPMFYNHSDMALPMGEWTSFEDGEDEFGEGLIGKGQMFLDTQDGKDTYAVLKRSPNLLQGVSIGVGGQELMKVDEMGMPTKMDDASGYWQIKGAYLKEVSITYQSADPQADIKELFHVDGNVNLSVIEKRLRDVGFPRAMAKQGCAAFKGLTLREVDQPVETKVAPDQRDVAMEFAKVAEHLELLKLSRTLSKGI